MLLHRTRLHQWLTHVGSPSRSGFSPVYLAWLVILVLLVQAQPVNAQSDQLTQQHESEVDSAKGYWRLKTQAATRSTLVQFFSADHRLLYEEILPEKWVKLSRKNQKQFDQLLEQLLANQLVGSRIKTELLPPTPVEPVPPRVTVRSTSDESTEPSMVAPYLVHAYVNASGKLYLIVDNPDRLRYKISVVDHGNRSLYEEFTNHNQYRRRLDLSALSVDSYQVVVQIGNKPFVYNVKRQDSRVVHSLQLPTTQQKQFTDEQIKEATKPSLVPTMIDL